MKSKTEWTELSSKFGSFQIHCHWKSITAPPCFDVGHSNLQWLTDQEQCLTIIHG